MKTTEPTRVDERPLSQDVLYALRYYLGGRVGLLVLVGILVTAGLVFNWSWLVAIGVAPLLIALAPCAVMCAVGLCAARMAGRSCSTESNPTQSDAPPAAVPTVSMAGGKASPRRTQPRGKATAAATQRKAKPTPPKGASAPALPLMESESGSEIATPTVSHVPVTASPLVAGRNANPAQAESAGAGAADASTEVSPEAAKGANDV